MNLSPLGALVRGLVAGVIGTAAMDAVWYRRYRQGGGTSDFLSWEFSGAIESWDKAPAPAQVGKRLTEAFLQRELPVEYAGLMNNVTHWAYGTSWAGLYGILAGSTRGRWPLWGLPFGALVWLSSYITLPLAKLYKPIWEYDRETLAKDLTAHLTFGAATASAFRLLAGR